MKDSIGDPKFPIWLIGDSPPKAWVNKLDTPLDIRHPARHNIWTSVVDPMQDRIYRESKLRLDTSKLYIRNAIDQPDKLPINENQTRVLQEKIETYKPKIILTFGVFAFMITRKASGEPTPVFYKTTKLLGEQFRLRIDKYNNNGVNILPLLHVSIARGRFLEAHRDFVDNNRQESPNYFDYVGIKIADLLLTKLTDKQIWIV